MRIIFLVAPALLLAGSAVAQSAGRADPSDPKATVAPVEFRSAFEGYRAFADDDLRDWRKANEEVGEAAGHAGQRPGQGSGQQTSKPQPGKAESLGGTAEKNRGVDQGHGGHK